MDGWSADVFVVCCVGSSVCDGLSTCSEEFCRVCTCVCACVCECECVLSGCACVYMCVYMCV